MKPKAFETLRPHEILALKERSEVLVVRPTKPQPDEVWVDEKTGEAGPIQKRISRPSSSVQGANEIRWENIECPYAPGQELWVQEGWAVEPGKEYTLTMPEYDGGQNPAHIIYKANDPRPELIKWRSPVTMPRWASRFTVRVERVECRQIMKVTEEEIQMAGVSLGSGFYFRPFMDMWSAYYGKAHSWASNPHCWLVWLVEEK